MSFFYRLRQRHRMGLGSLQFPNKGGFYDAQINKADIFETDYQGHKRIEKIDGIWMAKERRPDGKWLKVKALHFQGSTKKRIREFVL